MHTFLLDLWHDLREKRLWPVAALMLVAIAAVPFVLRQEEQSAPDPAAPATQAETASDRLPTIALDDASAKGSSNLSQFDQRNPFKPLNDLPADAPDSTEGENQTVDLGESPGGGSSKGGSGDAAVSSASSDKGSSGGSSGGSSDGGKGAGAGSYVGPRTTYFAYRADIRFGPPGKVKAMKQVEAFTLLGDDKEPAAMFMGVTDDHNWAVFAVDTARYEAEGEHECKPTPERCEFVYLKVAGDGNETTFTTLDGERTYDLELSAIKRVVLDAADVKDVPTEDDKSKSAAAKKRSTVDAEPRSFFDILAKRR